MKQTLNYSLNAICPYFTMFPLDFPLSVLADHAKKGQRVFDPFCGRGTTNYASRCLGLFSIGIDSSPVAAALTESKLVNASPESIIVEVNKILRETPRARDIPEGDFWRTAYNASVLNLICRFRESLIKDCSSDSKKALRGIIMGALHGPVCKTIKSYFSNQSPRTYAPKPNYAVLFWKKRKMLPPKVNVLQIIETRARRYYVAQPHVEGRVIKGDSSDPNTFTSIQEKFDWIITSPPYYGMNTYIPDQWLRLWFLGGKSGVDYSHHGRLEHSSPEVFSESLRKVWQNVSAKCNRGARLIVRFGGLNSRKADSFEILNDSFKQTGWHVLKKVRAGSASNGKRQALYFLEKNNKPFPEYDLWLALHK